MDFKKDFTIFEKFNHVDLVIEDNVDNITKIQKIHCRQYFKSSIYEVIVRSKFCYSFRK